jgi:hypothetical protein
VEPPKSNGEQVAPQDAVVTSGKTFFLANAETGTVKPPWNGPVFGNYGLVPITSTARAKTGSRSFKFEVPATTRKASSTVMANRPQVSMGGPSGHFMSGYYSFWVYLDAGFTTNNWNHVLGWMTGQNSPITYIGIERWSATKRNESGPLQLVFTLKNCGVGTYPCPTIANYTNVNAPEVYRMTASSPAGIVTFPRQQWVHISVYHKMAAANGQVKIWQNGTLIMDLTAPKMNTFVGHAAPNLGTNPAGDMVLQHFVYGGPESTTRRMYVDDFKVTDYRVQP